MSRKETRRLGMEHRMMPGFEIRAVGDEAERIVVARVVNYNVADSYGTVWKPGCFTDGMRSKLPKSVWGHDWRDPIGRVVNYEDSDDGLNVAIQFDEFDAVPRARQAWVQIRSGTIDNFSIGFDRKEWIPVPEDEQTRYGEHTAWEYMNRANIEEVSPVLIGSVPGTKPLAVRSALSPGLVEKVAFLLEQEVIDKDEARKLLEEADAKPVVETEETDQAKTEEPTTETSVEEPTEVPTADDSALLADLDAALELARGV